MNVSHLHVEFQDLTGAIDWMKRALDVVPKFQNPQMAIFELGNLSVNFDQAESDSKITLALKSLDCDKDFEALVARGATVIEKPNTKPYGVRSAYVRGPGKMIFEVDQPTV